LQRALAEVYGLHKRTVARILDRHSARQPRGLGGAAVDEAIRLYGQGLSLKKVGRLGVDAATIRKYLLLRGVRTRDSHGRTG